MTKEAPDDWKLLADTAAGDGAAFRALVERHQARVLALCHRMLGDRAEAEDAAQEVFLKTYRKAARLVPRGQLFTWIYRVAANHCLNLLRRRNLVRFLSLSESPETEPGLALRPASEAPGPDRRLDSRARWEATRQAIERLPATQRAVLVLARFEGLSYRQIAETLDISEGAVESRLVRAMRSLRRAQETTALPVSLEERGP